MYIPWGYIFFIKVDNSNSIHQSVLNCHNFNICYCTNDLALNSIKIKLGTIKSLKNDKDEKSTPIEIKLKRNFDKGDILKIGTFLLINCIPFRH